MNNIINIENRAGKIKLNDSVHKDSADQLIDELEKLYGESAVASHLQIGDITCSSENALESVDVEINSPGGSVMEGQRIYNALKGISSRGVEVVTTVNGLAASMGSVILMAGDQRKMTAGSRIMIHDASMMAYGNADDLRKQSNLLESISSEIASIYSERTNGTQDEMRALMKDETWMDAEQAKDLGFVDTIIKNGKEQTNQSPNYNTMFTKDKDLTAKLEASKTEVAEHEATIAKREAEAVTLSEDLSASVALVGEHEATITDLTAKLEASELAAESATAELVEKAAEAEAKAAEMVQAKVVTEEAVAAKAAELVQMAAHAPVADDGSDINTETDGQVLARYESISDKDDRRDFFASNKTKILRAKAQLTN